VASGYPGIGDRPSYQVTRGFVSNERFVLDDGGGDETYVQHTAPIDPGSSGGPLTTPEGKLLGVNTLKIRGRENVGLAVPASVVARALERVLSGVQTRSATADEQALAACEDLLEAAAGGPSALPTLERALGAELVAKQGLQSLVALPDEREKWIARFIDDPTNVFLRAIALRLERTPPTRDATHCERVPGQQAQKQLFKAQLAGASRSLRFELEQGRWKLVDVELGPSGGRSILDGVQPRSAAPKKWKPSLK
jgi:serine protease Do